MQHDADDDLLHDAFATHHLWKSSSLFDDATTYESLLFAPLQLDGESRPRRVASLPLQVDYTDDIYLSVQCLPFNSTIPMPQKHLLARSCDCQTQLPLNLVLSRPW